MKNQGVLRALKNIKILPSHPCFFYCIIIIKYTMPGTVQALRMHSGWTSQQAQDGGADIDPPITNEETCVPLSDTCGETRHEWEWRGQNWAWAQSSLTMHSPTQVTRVLRFGILARGVGMEGEAGKIREGLFCPAWTWASWETGNHQKILSGKDMCFQKTLLQKNEEWTGGNKWNHVYVPILFVGLSGPKSRILFFGLFHLLTFMSL